MISSKILKIKKNAVKSFGKNLVNLGFGGSYNIKKKNKDWDVVLILNDFKINQIQLFVRLCKSNHIVISPSVVTKIQPMKNWPSKALVMLNKGMMWVNYDIKPVSPSFLSNVIKKNSNSDLYAIERKLISGDLKIEKAFSLMRQIITLCR